MASPTTRVKAAAFQFQPFSLQQKKLLTWWMPQSPYSNWDMVVAEGSVRAGKTVAMIDSFLTWSLSSFQNRDFICAGRSSGALERNVLRPMFQILTAKGIPYDYHRGDNRHVAIGTNLYHCFGANNEKSQDYVQGLTAAGGFGDEAALMPQSFIEQMKARCSVDGAKIWLNCNPQGPFHPIKQDYIDKAEQHRALALHFTMNDNLSLSEATKERYKRMFTGVFYKRFIIGLWVMAEGSIYDMWDDSMIFTDSSQPITLAEGYLQRYVTIDYGTTNPMVYLDVLDDGETLWVTREYCWDSKKQGRQKTDSQYADDLVDFIGPREDAQVVLDPSAASFAAELMSRGIIVTDADNDVLDGIRMTSTMMSRRMIRVHERCENLIGEIGSYVWDEKAALRGIEQPVKKSDHALDALRYLVKTKISQWRLAA
jgi:PBSX family phage terminase large subunit